MLLAKVPGLSANAFFSMQSEPSYAKILRRCDRTSAVMAAFGAGFLWRLLKLIKRTGIVY